jgi:hypothetical protein
VEDNVSEEAYAPFTDVWEAKKEELLSKPKEKAISKEAKGKGRPPKTAGSEKAGSSGTKPSKGAPAKDGGKTGAGPSDHDERAKRRRSTSVLSAATAGKLNQIYSQKNLK